MRMSEVHFLLLLLCLLPSVESLLHDNPPLAPAVGEHYHQDDNTSTEGVVVLNLDQQMFIPTLPPIERVDPVIGLGRYDLKIHSTTEDSPGILTIGTESPWEDEEFKSSQEAAYGTWRSPITSDVVVTPTNVIAEPPQVDPVTGYVFWCEQISKDGYRNAVFHYNPETRETVRWTGREYDVRTKLQEHAGGSFTIYNNSLFFSHGDDGAIYRQDGPTATPVKLTNSPSRKYGDVVYTPQWNSLFFVMEEMESVEEGKPGRPKYSIAMVDASTGTEEVLVGYANNFATPRISQDGNFLPWDETKMFVAEIKNKNGKLAIIRFFQHGSMMMPSFDQNNELFYVHDSTGWWNLYRVTRRGFEINLTPESREIRLFTFCRLGRQAYAVNPRIGSNEAVVICGHDLTVVDLMKEKRRVIKTGYTSYSLGVAYSRDGTKVYVVAGDGLRNPRLVEVEVKTGVTRVVSGAADLQVDVGYLSTARLIQFPTTQGDFAYGYLYMPKNKDYQAPAGTKPPLLVKVHEGPTGAASAILNLGYQFFTSRGFAILDVDYRGSTGYGKIYRNKLNEMFVMGFQENLVDPDKLCIDGSSTSAYTTLSALTIAESVFKAGASYYGVSDPLMLATNIPKFKKNYVETLIGNPDKHKDRYVTRSPLKNYERLEVPTLFFHGTEDKIVPASQARNMYELVRSKGLPAAFVLFQGEGHGFTNPENLKRALEAEFFFFAQVFNFTPADITSDVVIDNLETWKSTQ
ncbi:Dipeptidyl aminopeptidase BIII-like [Homarus americanus]|uniref:Dipeptidyl aminopeptidase BIII-like n=1 Tax=Homarus americanus TaxID=6706 RepID=A0A8J5JLR7_HOMAM|nr:Dipeptidyl aminopeptidase BIII-like [Homarus americanus]